MGFYFIIFFFQNPPTAAARQGGRGGPGGRGGRSCGRREARGCRDPGPGRWGLRPLSASPLPPPAAQRPSQDNVLFPGDRAGHQRSLHLFIFLNISYFERLINNKESEIGMGALSVLFLWGRGVSGWVGGGLLWQGSREGRGAPTGCSAPASTQGCSPGDNSGVDGRGGVSQAPTEEGPCGRTSLPCSALTPGGG